ncbi:MAG TPA: hypothetical protein VJV21_01320 [Pyrinomonadaceae bacterium]|nr:hypothetical protein [Pyrinomonadaceae bacterium]
MVPVTLAPLCVKTTSDAPKSLPLVHHLPSIDAGAEFVRLLDDDDAVAAFVGFVGLGVLVLEPGFDFVSVVVVLPPAGWAATPAAAAAKSMFMTKAVKDALKNGVVCDIE